MNRILITLSSIILFSVTLIAQSENVGIGTTNPTSKLHVQDGNVKIMNATRPWMIFDHPAGTLNGGLHWWQDGVVEMELFYDDINESLRFWDTPSGVPRIILSRSGNFGIGQASPNAKLHVQNGSALFTGILNTSSPDLPPAEGAGTRMMWYDDKAAFRAGHLQVGAATFWNKDNIGYYSFAVGRSTKAQGSNSSAFGRGTDASGYSSTAMGEYTTASGFYSTAFGQETDASGYSSTAMGEYTTAEAYGSVAMGRFNVGGGDPIGWVDTDPIFEIGIGTGDLNRSNAMTVYKNAGALWEGAYDNTSPDAPPTEGAGTRMMWYPAKAAFRAGHLQVGAATFWNKDNIGDYSFAVGLSTKAKGSNSSAFGRGTDASGYSSTAMGEYTTASGFNSTAMGYSTTASGFYSTATGENTNASGSHSTAMGYTTTTSGQSSTAMGEFTDAEANASVAMGRYNVGGGNPTSWVDTDPIFEIGIGNSSIPANAMTVLKNGIIKVDQQIRASSAGGLDLASDEGTIRVKIEDGGDVGIGTTNPQSKLHVDGTGGTKIRVEGASSTVGVEFYNGTTFGSSLGHSVTNDYLFLYNNGNVIVKDGNLGVGQTTITAGRKIDVFGGAYCNGADWVNGSSKDIKENFMLVSGQEVLRKLSKLDVLEWNYIGEDYRLRHIGPMAQDFYAAFGLGNDNTSISTVDISGVALSAIKQLHEDNKALQEKNDALTSTMQDLLSRVEDLESARKQ